MTGKRLVNPDLAPKVFALTGVSAATKTSFYFADACGIATQKALVDTTNGVAFGIANGFIVANLKNFLFSYALLISEFRFEAEDAADLVNNLTLIRCGVDGQSDNEVIFSSDATTPFANNANLLVVKRPFILTASTAMKITVTDGENHDYTLTFTVKAMIPYGMLDLWLEKNPIYAG
jgi:hypothetical protein